MCPLPSVGLGRTSTRRRCCDAPIRESGKVKKETLANLSHLPAEAIDAIRRVLRGETLMSVEDAFEIERSLPAGHVNAALCDGVAVGVGEAAGPASVAGRGICAWR